MTSTVSPSPRSPEPRRRKRRGWATWPEDLLLPVLIATVQALAITPLLNLFLGPDFGLTGGRDVPWPGWLAMLGLAAFGLCRFVSRLTGDARVFQAVLAAGWLVGALAWLGVEQVYGVRGLLTEPGSLVTERGYLVVPMLLSLGIWWQGIRYATNEFIMTADEVRGSTQRAWLVLIGSLLFAAMLDNPAGRDALSSALVVVPLAAVASIALVAAAEVHSSRQQIRESGGRPPTWARWSRLVSGVGMGVMVVAVLVLVLLTPGAFAAVIAAGMAVLQVIGQLLLWVLYGLFYVIYYVVVAVAELLRALFGFELNPMPPPEPAAPLEGQFQFEEGEQEEWRYAPLLRWALLGLVVLAVILILFRITRGRALHRGNAIGDEERSSVFSTDLAKAQLRDLLRRRHRGQRIPVLDLDRAPASVRESWRYLQVLAVRQEVARRDAETPQDFAGRLRAVWPGTAASLNELARRYERSRYGEIDSDRDRDAAIDAWTDVYRRRREIEPDHHRG